MGVDVLEVRNAFLTLSVLAFEVRNRLGDFRPRDPVSVPVDILRGLLPALCVRLPVALHAAYRPRHLIDRQQLALRVLRQHVVQGLQELLG